MSFFSPEQEGCVHSQNAEPRLEATWPRSFPSFRLGWDNLMGQTPLICRNRVTAPALLKRFGSTAVRLTPAGMICGRAPSCDA